MPEWTRIGTSALQRRLRGAELLLNYSEQNQEGNYQLTFSAEFETNLTVSDLQDRCYAAWFRVRQVHPVIGIELVSPQENLFHATFYAFQSGKEAEEWSKETCILVQDGKSVKDVTESIRQRGISSNGKRAVMYFVLNPRLGSKGFVLNISHVLSGHHALNIVEEFAEQLAKGGGAATFQKEDLNILEPLLPKSAIQAYHETFNPTARDVELAWQTQAKAAERYTKNTIGVPIHKESKTRKSVVHNLAFTLSESEVNQILPSLKKRGLTLTSAFYACICSTIATQYHTGSEQGAHLLFSAHAKRWLDTENKKEPIAMAIVPAGAWIEATEAQLKAKDVNSLTKLAKQIAMSQEEDISSPHVLATLDKIAEDAVAHQTESTKQGQEQALPTVARPTLTSQGQVVVKQFYSGDDDTRLELTDWYYGGRNTDPVVCFAAHNFRKQFRYYLMFDQRFFDLGEIAKLGHDVGALFRLFAKDTSIDARL